MSSDVEVVSSPGKGTVWDTLRVDPIVRLSVVVLAVFLLVYVSPLLSREQAGVLGSYSADAILIVLAIFAFQHRLRQVDHVEVRHFWDLITAAYLCWLGVELLNIVPDWWGDGASIRYDFLYLLYYVFVLLAIAMNPHCRSGWSSDSARYRIEAAGAVFFLLGLLTYFVLIPNAVNRSAYASNVPSLLFYVVSDGVLVFSFFYLQHVCGSNRWRALYGLLAVASALWFDVDLIESLMFMDVLPWVPYGSALDLIWYLPFVPLVLAARIRHHPFPAAEDDPAEDSETADVKSPLFLRGTLITYAAVFPLVHFALYTLGVLDPASREAREACVLLALLVLGGLAFVHHVVLERERLAVQEALRESDRRLQTVFESCPVVVFALDSDGAFTLSEGKGLAALGLEPGEVVGQSVFEIYSDLPEILNSVRRTLAGAPCSGTVEVNGLYFETQYLPIKNADNQVSGLLGVATDITERKQLEEQLRQSQKMEAIGRLAGGVAHDFNNLLTAVAGYVEFSLEGIEPESPLAHDLRQIRVFTDRATRLTQQLLTFSRRQPLATSVVNLNEMVEETMDMLRRLLGEDLELRFVLADDLGQVRADPAQLQRVLMNLVMNARDAISDGGSATIETGNRVLDEEYVSRHPDARPGSFVTLSVTDTGCGMDETTRQQVFEPFFTTKEVGKGTGLGLATVYGIVKQHRGHISVRSRLGEGAHFEVFLPRVDEGVEFPNRPETD